jgi:mannose/fructose/N-acetylgalactosamine-specific phosphotransferase system component IIC
MNIVDVGLTSAKPNPESLRTLFLAMLISRAVVSSMLTERPWWVQGGLETVAAVGSHLVIDYLSLRY